MADRSVHRETVPPFSLRPKVHCSTSTTVKKETAMMWTNPSLFSQGGRREGRANFLPPRQNTTMEGTNTNEDSRRGRRDDDPDGEKICEVVEVNQSPKPQVQMSSELRSVLCTGKPTLPPFLPSFFPLIAHLRGQGRQQKFDYVHYRSSPPALTAVRKDIGSVTDGWIMDGQLLQMSFLERESLERAMALSRRADRS